MRIDEPRLADEVDDKAVLGLDVRERVLGALALGDGEGDDAGGDVEEAVGIECEELGSKE